MSEPFAYYYNIAASAWIVTLHGVEVDRFMNEDEARAYCEHENDAMRSGGVDDDGWYPGKPYTPRGGQP
jgi:hypothetical protein